MVKGCKRNQPGGWGEEVHGGKQKSSAVFPWLSNQQPPVFLAKLWRAVFIFSSAMV